MRHSILEVYLRDHAHQLEYNKQYPIIETYFTSAHYLFSIHEAIIYGQVHAGFTIDNIVSMVTYPIRRNKLLKMHDR